ncbi:MAG: LON peptidase substrate-binding domain-containing protein [Caldilineales bacterium]|nr:LON peptidase substrate-binding domain-containing protein [Caldilineales bacterium]
MTDLIPLFPLPLVLFPGEVRPLRIFEPRYRTMLQDCLSDDRPFGIVLVHENQFQAGSALPYFIGTLAHIDRVENMPDGTYGIGIHGGDRFRIADLRYDKPYLQGVVDELAPQRMDDDLAGELHRHLGRVLSNYVEALTQASGIRFGVNNLPDDTQQLAYLTAILLQVNNEVKQSLLEMDDPVELIATEFDLLATEMDLMSWIIDTITTTQAVGFGSDGWMNLN